MFGMSRAQVRAYDRRAATLGLTTRALMESAGRGAAETLVRAGVDGPVVVCCAKGNNGGDGLVLARWLHVWGVRAEAFLLADPETLTPDAGDAWRALIAADVPHRTLWPADLATLRAALARSAWAVDALFGIGVTASLREPFAEVVSVLNSAPYRRFALDLPSGLDADTGVPLGPTVRATRTATFVAPKLGFANAASRAWTGPVHVVALGLAPLGDEVTTR